MKHFYAFILASMMMLCSCSSHQQLTYFYDAESIEPIDVGNYLVKIQPADELFITVSSSSPEATAPYNVPGVNPVSNENLLISTQVRQRTFVVDSKGFIDFPILGEIHVAGMTLEDLKDFLTQRISKDVEDPIVNVQLVNFFVNVAGEVKEPGRYPINSARYSVLDALTAAGDLTPYGMRDNVMIVREENGKRVVKRLNLNSAETLSSPEFFVKQNDYIYVEPTEVRRDNAEYNQNNSFKLSMISTIVSGCSVVLSLIIALTR